MNASMSQNSMVDFIYDIIEIMQTSFVQTMLNLCSCYLTKV